ncbi:Cof-type HAD-IIB family hydrolase [uncultured Anaerococcus sp.]|uniref:Cof-type HAD-IIB family hydrolase n=1 Tax=uncultured Anaerococcus sp. TaxID=293428 RepID=UPI0025DDA1ED|nr:Cof-type HAD-IIB family hydrolase [uncultured Anaerococcus sp.]
MSSLAYKMTKKLIAVDLDGTLLTSTNTISKKSKEIIEKVLNAGHKVVIITGRDFYGSIKVARELFDRHEGGLVASSNGALVFDLAKDKPIINHTIPREVVKEMIAYGKSLGLDYLIYHDNKILAEKDDAYDLDFLSKKNKLEVEIIEDLADKLDFDLNKLLFSAQPSLIEKVKSDFEEQFKGKVNPIHSMPQFLDCMPAGIHKGRSLLEIADFYGIDHKDTLAFGDEINDETMIEMAGIGIAMANASDYIKNLADDICPTNDDDGISLYLEENIL